MKKKNYLKLLKLIQILGEKHTTRDDERVLGLVRNAGTILIGPYSPVAASDYVAGPSHVLPTGGGARFASGLTARDFIKSTSVVRLTRAGLEKAADDIRTLAEAEGLAGHARSVSVRLEAPGEVREKGEAGRRGPRSGGKAGRKT